MKKLAVMISVILIIIALSLVNSYDSPNSFEIDFETQLNTLNEYFLNSKYSVVEEKDVENNSTLLQTLLPPLWSEVPSLDKSNFDMDSQGRFIIDVWNYTNRMALYKHLIENINHCEWSSPSNIGKIFHDSSLNSSDLNLNPGSILWGLPLQHGWQYSSGRLFVEENRYICCTHYIINRYICDINTSIIIFIFDM